MPELPEIANLAGQMAAELAGKRLTGPEVVQEKCLNVAGAEFRALVEDKTIAAVRARGKWIFVSLHPATTLLLNLGMGGELLYHPAGAALPEKFQARFAFSDGTALTAAFSWFGYVHTVRAADLATHKMTASLGLSPLDVQDYTYANFLDRMRGRKGAIKPWLLDQKNIAGIGNVYVQDILFRTRLHPDRKIPELDETERQTLFRVIRENLVQATELGGLVYEKDLYGQPGRFKDFLVGYREGKPCPVCGTAVEKIRTGSTASYICPMCQQ